MPSLLFFYLIEQEILYIYLLVFTSNLILFKVELSSVCLQSAGVGFIVTFPNVPLTSGYIMMESGKWVYADSSRPPLQTSVVIPYACLKVILTIRELVEGSLRRLFEKTLFRHFNFITILRSIITCTLSYLRSLL